MIFLQILCNPSRAVRAQKHVLRTQKGTLVRPARAARAQKHVLRARRARKKDYCLCARGARAKQYVYARVARAKTYFWRARETVFLRARRARKRNHVFACAQNVSFFVRAQIMFCARSARKNIFARAARESKSIVFCAHAQNHVFAPLPPSGVGSMGGAL